MVAWCDVTLLARKSLSAILVVLFAFLIFDGSSGFLSLGFVSFVESRFQGSGFCIQLSFTDTCPVGTLFGF